MIHFDQKYKSSFNFINKRKNILMSSVTSKSKVIKQLLKQKPKDH